MAGSQPRLIDPNARLAPCDLPTDACPVLAALGPVLPRLSAALCAITGGQGEVAADLVMPCRRAPGGQCRCRIGPGSGRPVPGERSCPPIPGPVLQ
ncbi:hypothetical protein [Rubellimicrobium sp. CFH 75288]|uniref:hypothetical protein n=1 Tax=Rubellimicrobium sp. CFH 75288 TaxID=2697034 RepID=UPI001412A5C7|nr:hypothetical protein [Rubellimicrobium sp. CFH 75288]NAZ37223.1 hypothetical protein [Rubellimicrobium sp. CFH 75288]